MFISVSVKIIILFRKKRIWVDALRNGRIAVEHVRQKPKVTPQSTKLFPDLNKFFGTYNYYVTALLLHYRFRVLGQKHTLMLVQPDFSMVDPVTGRVVGAEVFVSWLLANIADGHVETGTEVLPYLGISRFHYSRVVCFKCIRA